MPGRAEAGGTLNPAPAPGCWRGSKEFLKSCEGRIASCHGPTQKTPLSENLAQSRTAGLTELDVWLRRRTCTSKMDLVMEIEKAALSNGILMSKAEEMFRGTLGDAQFCSWLIPTGGFASTQLVSKRMGLVPRGQSKAGSGVSNLESTGPDGLRVRWRFPRGPGAALTVHQGNK